MINASPPLDELFWNAGYLLVERLFIWIAAKGPHGCAHALVHFAFAFSGKPEHCTPAHHGPAGEREPAGHAGGERKGDEGFAAEIF